MNKWIKYGVASIAISVAQMGLAEASIQAVDSEEMAANIDMDQFGGSKLKDRMLHDGGPAVEIVRAFSKAQLLKEIES